MLCFESVAVCAITVTAVTVIIIANAATQPDMRFSKVYNFLASMPVPWVGALTIGEEDDNATKIVILVVIISEKTGIADARSMATLNKHDWKKIRNSTRVMFWTKNIGAWYAKVKKFILHPDFRENTLSTLAFLNLEYDLKEFKGNLPGWPFKINYTSYSDEQLFAIGYTDWNRTLEQIVFPMAYIKLSDCQYFYITEELDTRWMRPKYYHCYNVRFSKETCVFNPGMPLIHYSRGTCTLIGISVWGPGCSLPARFIDLEPFVPWIKSNMPTRRFWEPEDINVEPFKDRHKWVLARLKDSKELALRPLNLNKDQKEEKEIVHGKCKDNDMLDGKRIYQDSMTFTSGDRPFNQRIKAIAVYALSLYDLNYNKTHYTCIQVTARCKQKSDSILEFTKGFDNFIHPFQAYVKTLPIQNSINKDVYPPYVYTIKKSPEADSYEILGSDITQLIFKFEFEKEAYIEVNFYGNRSDAYPTPELTTHSIPIYDHTRDRRPYKTSTKNPPRPYYYYEKGYLGIPYKYTTLSVTRKRTTSTTKRSKGTRTTSNPNWWNKWWRLHKDKLPTGYKDWWKG